MAPSVWIPRYAAPDRPYGLIPPSPPAETRQRKRRLVQKDLTTYTGRVLLPEQRGYEETVRAIGTGIFLPGAAQARRFVSPPASGGGSNSGSGGSFTSPSAGWRLENTNDATPSSNTLTNNGSVAFSAGKINNAAQFTGSTSVYLSGSDSASLEIATGKNLSLSLWIFLTATGLHTFIEKGTNATGTLEWLFREAFGTIRFDVGTDASTNPDSLASSGTVTASAWHLLCGTVTASGTYQQAITIDNGTATTGNLTHSTLLTAHGTLLIGKRDDGQPHNGAIDSVWFWNNYKLLSADIASLWNSGNGGEPI